MINAGWWRSQVTARIALTLALTVSFLAMTVADLGRYPRVHGDVSWAMSASHKLATSGVFGSDLDAGFFGAEQRYFIALPVHPLLQAVSFVLFGSGITQARRSALQHPLIGVMIGVVLVAA